MIHMGHQNISNIRNVMHVFYTISFTHFFTICLLYAIRHLEADAHNINLCYSVVEVWHTPSILLLSLSNCISVVFLCDLILNSLSLSISFYLSILPHLLCFLSFPFSTMCRYCVQGVHFCPFILLAVTDKQMNYLLSHMNVVCGCFCLYRGIMLFICMLSNKIYARSAHSQYSSSICVHVWLTSISWF